MCELGKRLKEAREAKGLDLAQAAEALKVRRVVLEALEDCRFDELPEPLWLEATSSAMPNC